MGYLRVHGQVALLDHNGDPIWDQIAPSVIDEPTSTGTIDTVGHDQVQNLTTVDCTLVGAVDTASHTQLHNSTVADATSTGAVDSVSLQQIQDLAVADATSTGQLGTPNTEAPEVADSAFGSTDSTNTLTGSLTIPSGFGQKLVVLAYSESSNAWGVTSCTFNALELTKAGEALAGTGTGFQNVVELWYMDSQTANAIPSPGTYTLSLTYEAGDSNYSHGFYAYALNNAAPGAFAGIETATTASGTYLEVFRDLLQENTLMLTGAVHGNADSFLHPGGYTEDWDQAITGGMTMGAARRLYATTGSKQVAWSFLGASRRMGILAVAARPVPFEINATVTDNTTATAVDTVLHDQIHVMQGLTLSGNPTVDTVSVTGTQYLTPADADGDPTVDAVGMTIVYHYVTADVDGVALIDPANVTGTQYGTAADATSVGAIDQTEMVQLQIATPPDLTAATEVDTVAATRVVNLTPAEATSGTEIDSLLAVRVVSATVAELDSTGAIDGPAAAHIHVMNPQAINGRGVIDDVQDMNQLEPLFFDEPTSTGEIDSLVLTTEQDLDPFYPDPVHEIDAVVAKQIQYLTAVDIEGISDPEVVNLTVVKHATVAELMAAGVLSTFAGTPYLGKAIWARRFR